MSYKSRLVTALPFSFPLLPSSRIITSIKGTPGDYGVDEGKLRPFEKLLQNLEGKLMEGRIFQVRVKWVSRMVAHMQFWTPFGLIPRPSLKVAFGKDYM